MVAVGWKAKDPTAQRETLSALGNPSHFKARVTSRKLSLSQLAFSLPLLEGERDFLFFYLLLGQISLFLCLLKVSLLFFFMILIIILSVLSCLNSLSLLI